MPLTSLPKPHTGGVSFGGMTTAPWSAERLAEQRAMMDRAVEAGAAARAASPTGRFLACVNAIRRAAEVAQNEALHGAALRAIACAERGLAGELAHAENCLAELDLLGADVRSARVAPDELAHGRAA